MFSFLMAQASKIRGVLTVASLLHNAVQKRLSLKMLKYEADPSGPKTYTAVPVLDHL
jgi:hypothetical protein